MSVCFLQEYTKENDLESGQPGTEDESQDKN